MTIVRIARERHALHRFGQSTNGLLNHRNAMLLLSCLCCVTSFRCALADDAERDAWLQRAWQASSPEEKERYILQAGRVGHLRNGDLRSLQVAQLQLGKSDDALATARRNFRENGGLGEKEFLCESLEDHGNYPEARGLLRGILRTPGQDFDHDPIVQTQIQKVAIKVMEVTVRLGPHDLTAEGQKLLGQRGYHELIYSEDVPYQRTVASIEGCERYETTTDPVGNRVMHIWPKSDGAVQVHLTITQIPMAFDLSRADQPAAMPEAMKAFLGRTIQIDPTTPTVAGIVAEIRGATRLQTVRNVLTYWHQRLKWSIDPYPDELRSLPLSEVTLRTGHCLCSGISCAGAALLRGAGIPARTVGVYNGVEPAAGRYVGGHSIVEFYEPSINCWVPIEDGIQLGRLCRSFARKMIEDPAAPYDMGLRDFHCTYAPPKGDVLSNVTQKCVRMVLDEVPSDGARWTCPPPASVTLVWDEAQQVSRVEHKPAAPGLFADSRAGSVQAVQDRLAASPELVFATDAEWGATPLHWAALAGEVGMATTLLEAGAGCGARDDLGRTPLHYAAFAGMDELVRALLSRGADPAAQDVEGFSTHDYALQQGQQTTAALLAGAQRPERD